MLWIGSRDLTANTELSVRVGRSRELKEKTTNEQKKNPKHTLILSSC